LNVPPPPPPSGTSTISVRVDCFAAEAPNARDMAITRFLTKTHVQFSNASTVTIRDFDFYHYYVASFECDDDEKAAARPLLITARHHHIALCATTAIGTARSYPGQQL
jgi:hypothetical protein